MTTKSQKDFIVDSIVEDMAQMLMEDTQCGITEALDIIYNSETYDKLCDYSTNVFTQSAAYNYSILQHEQKYGKICS